MQYDTAFQRQVAISKDLHWVKINPTLYSICFAGHARCLACCTMCLSTKLCISHTHYSQTPLQWPQPQPPWPALRQRAATVEICMLYNSREGSRCTFAHCKYAHICLYCRGACTLSSRVHKEIQAWIKTECRGEQQASKVGGPLSLVNKCTAIVSDSCKEEAYLVATLSTRCCQYSKCIQVFKLMIHIYSHLCQARGNGDKNGSSLGHIDSIQAPPSVTTI